VKTDDPRGIADLQQWVSWFKDGGIACVIAETDKGYAVYRLGLHDDADE
jgi:hypothetical protein